MKTSSSMNGLSNMKFLLNGLILMITSLLPTLNLAGTTKLEELPSVELLEFLSEWETDQGEWAGPAQFEDDSFDQLFEDDENAEEENEDIDEAEDAE